MPKKQKKEQINVYKIITMLMLVVLTSIGLVFVFNFIDKKEIKKDSIDLIIKDEEKELQNEVQPDNSDSVENKDSIKKEKETPKQYEDYEKTGALSGVINYADFVDNNLKIRVTLNEILSSGICRLSIKQGANIISKKTNVISNPNSSTCAGFDIPGDEIKNGVIELIINIESDEKKLELKKTITKE